MWRIAAKCETQWSGLNVVVPAHMLRTFRQLGPIGALGIACLIVAVDSDSATPRSSSLSQSQPDESQNPKWAPCLVRPESSVLDFGEIATTKQARTKLRIRNYGTETRVLLRAQSKGPVSSNLLPRTEIPPGESVEVEFGIQAPPRPGMILNKSFSLVCEDQEPIVLPVRATAISFVEAEPATIDLDGEENPEICLRSIDGLDFRVIESIPDCIDYISCKPRNVHLLALNSVALRGAGLKRIIVLKTDHPQCESVTLSIKRRGFEGAEGK